VIRICGVTKQGEVVHSLTVEDLQRADLSWCWVDLSEPTVEEYTSILTEHFEFHPLAVEDCLEYIQRPKVDFYDGYHFLVVHSISRESLEPQEVDLFVGERFLVSFHLHGDKAVSRAWEKFSERSRVNMSPLHLTHMIIDQLVDNYFAPVYTLEDRLNDIDDNLTKESSGAVLEEVFDIRSDLSKLRRTIKAG
jgi:magnesium transporter